MLFIGTNIIDGFINGTAKVTVFFAWIHGVFDKYVVDGLVNGIANTLQFFGWITRQFQTGRIQNYLVGLIIGLFVIIGFYVI